MTSCISEPYIDHMILLKYDIKRGSTNRSQTILMKSLIRNAIFIKYVNETSTSKNGFSNISLLNASFLSCFAEYFQI